MIWNNTAQHSIAETSATPVEVFSHSKNLWLCLKDCGARDEPIGERRAANAMGLSDSLSIALDTSK
jgi:hypothetical protein